MNNETSKRHDQPQGEDLMKFWATIFLVGKKEEEKDTFDMF